MPLIELVTVVRAPKQVCFDLSRSIDLHKISTSPTKEEAIAGVTSGLIGPDEFVTWRARHFGIVQRLTTRITAFRSPDYFADEMVKGAFRRFRHEHHFQEVEEGTRMADFFDYDPPFGLLGRLVDLLVLRRYMTNFLIQRNAVIKEFAETGKWKDLIG